MNRQLGRASGGPGGWAEAPRGTLKRAPHLLVILALLAGCSKQAEKETEPVIPVELSEVRRGPIRQVIAAEGVLYPRDQASVTAKIGAPVRAFYVNRGAHVRKGQLLATLENRDLQAAAHEGKAQYEQAQAVYRRTTAAALPEEVSKSELDVESAKQALEAAQKLYTSRQQLFQEGALARRLVDEAQVAFVQARTQYETTAKHLAALHEVSHASQMKEAAAQLEAAKGHHESAEAQLSYTEIRSPIDGVVTDRPLYAGEMASAGTPLLTVMDLSRVVVRANIPVSQAAPLKAGNNATLSPAEGAGEVAGIVTVVSPAVDPNSTTVQVWVEAPNAAGRLKPGGTARVSILAGVLDDAVLAAPAALVGASDGGTSVFVVGKDMVARERKVEVGVREAGQVQILKGVAPGEMVVTTGNVGLEDGAKVRLAKAEPHE